MKIALNSYAYWLILASSLTGCINQRAIMVDKSSIHAGTITRLRSKNPAQAPVVFGKISILERGVLFPASQVSVCVDKECADRNKPIYQANNEGYYLRILEPGTHSLMITFVGLKPELVENLRVDKGDSIRIDFQLQPDMRPLH